MKRIVVAIAACFPLVVPADPAPFGLEIGKARVKDMKDKYSAQEAGINQYSAGEMYDLDVAKLGFEGLQTCRAIFDKEGKLAAVLATLPKRRFDEIFQTLKGKYRLHGAEIPFVGDKSARFQDGSTRIMLDAPHLSFTMTMNYVRDDLWRAFQEQSRKSKENKKQKEAAKL